MDRSPTSARIRQSVRLGAAVAVAAMLALVTATPVVAVPPLPSAFYGTVTDATTGGPAPVGLPVRAEILGTVVASTATYSHLNETVYSLETLGDDADTGTTKEGGLPGESMAIIVGDAELGEVSQATIWQGGSNVRLDLIWTPASSQPPAPDGGGNGGAPADGSTADGEGPVVLSPLPAVTIMGVPVEGITGNGVTRFDGGRVIIEFSADVTATLADGSPVATVTIDEAIEAPALPEDRLAVGAILDAAPDGATFSPPLTFTIGYSETDIPDGGDPTTLGILRHDGAEWLAVDSTVDSAAGRVTAAVDRFSRFALTVARPATTGPPGTEPPSEPTTAPAEPDAAPAEPDAALEPETTPPAETIAEPEPEGEPEPQVEPGPAAPLPESVAEAPPQSEPAEAPAGPTNWWLVGGLAFTIVVGLFLLYRVSRQLWGGRYG